MFFPLAGTCRVVVDPHDKQILETRIGVRAQGILHCIALGANDIFKKGAFAVAAIVGQVTEDPTYRFLQLQTTKYHQNG